MKVEKPVTAFIAGRRQALCPEALYHWPTQSLAIVYENTKLKD
jgi:hypothetical protein